MKTEIKTRTIFITLIVTAYIPMIAVAQTASFKSLGLLHSANPDNCCYAISADGSTILSAALDAEKGYQAQPSQNNVKSLLPISTQPYRQCLP